MYKTTIRLYSRLFLISKISIEEVFIIVMWLVLNLKDMQWNDPQIFTKIVVMVAVLWLLGRVFLQFEQQQKHEKIGRTVFLGVLIGYLLYKLEGYILTYFF